MSKYAHDYKTSFLLRLVVLTICVGFCCNFILFDSAKRDNEFGTEKTGSDVLRQVDANMSVVPETLTMNQRTSQVAVPETSPVVTCEVRKISVESGLEMFPSFVRVIGFDRVRMGTVYGGFVMPENLCILRPGDVVYNFGCGEDVSFDVALAAMYNVRTRMFDPTPRAIAHVETVLESVAIGRPPVTLSGSRFVDTEGVERIVSGAIDSRVYFENIVSSGVRRDQLEFYFMGAGVKDGTMMFHPPASGVSHSLVSGDENEEKGAFPVPVRSVESLMREFGDSYVALLKMDIEGFETDVIPSLVSFWKTKMPREKWPKVLAFDMDSVRKGHPHYNEVKGKQCMQMLEQELGYRQFSWTGGADIVYVLD